MQKDYNLFLGTFFCRSIIRWYWRLSCCDVLLIEINNEMKCYYVSTFFHSIAPNSVAHWARGSSVGLEFKTRWRFTTFTSTTIFKSYFFG